jgi:hypothetical protein
MSLHGALLTLVINQSLVFFVTLAFCYRTSWYELQYLPGGIDKQTATIKPLGKLFHLMKLISC